MTKKTPKERTRKNKCEKNLNSFLQFSGMNSFEVPGEHRGYVRTHWAYLRFFIYLYSQTTDSDGYAQDFVLPIPPYSDYFFLFEDGEC